MIERIRLALRPWVNGCTDAERHAILHMLAAEHKAQVNAAEEVASWRYEPAPEDAPGAPPTDKMQLGKHAKRLLDDSVMKLAIEHVTADLMKTWRETACEDTDTREDAYRMLRALDGVEFKLRRFAGNAALIAAEQRRKEEQEARR